MPRVGESIQFSLAADSLRGTVKTDLPAPTTPYKRDTFTNVFKGLQVVQEQSILENRTDAGCKELTGERNAKC